MSTFFEKYVSQSSLNKLNTGMEKIKVNSASYIVYEDGTHIIRDQILSTMRLMNFEIKSIDAGLLYQKSLPFSSFRDLRIPIQYIVVTGAVFFMHGSFSQLYSYAEVNKETQQITFVCKNYSSINFSGDAMFTYYIPVSI